MKTPIVIALSIVAVLGTAGAAMAVNAGTLAGFNQTHLGNVPTVLDPTPSPTRASDDVTPEPTETPEPSEHSTPEPGDDNGGDHSTAPSSGHDGSDDSGSHGSGGDDSGSDDSGSGGHGSDD